MMVTGCAPVLRHIRVGMAKMLEVRKHIFYFTVIQNVVNDWLFSKYILLLIQSSVRCEERDVAPW